MISNEKQVELLPWLGPAHRWLTRGGAEVYRTQVEQPPLSPPSVVFPMVWTVLFALMGVGMALVQGTPPSAARALSLRIFLVQLAFNFCWSIIFFNFQSYGVAFVWLLVLWVLILWMIHSFRKLDTAAAWLQLPYLLWVGFAGYLNLGVWLLN